MCAVVFMAFAIGKQVTLTESRESKVICQELLPEVVAAIFFTFVVLLARATTLDTRAAGISTKQLKF